MRTRPFQTLSRADTEMLGSGVCPACRHIRFIAAESLLHHERGCFRRILCIHCLREYGVAPAVEGGALAVILDFVLPNHLLLSNYRIITGPQAPARPSLPGGPTGSVLPSVKAVALP